MTATAETTALPDPAPVACVRAPSREAFRRDFVRPGRPAVIRDAIADWPALGRWSAGGLAARCGDVQVSLTHSPDGIFAPYAREAGPPRTEELPLAAALERLLATREPGGERWSVKQTALRARFPALADDVRVPPYLGAPSALSELNVWISPEGAVTVLHYDVEQNLLAQVLGRKDFLLFPPGDLERLYPFPRTSGTPHCSRLVVFAAAGRREFPAAPTARPHACRVEPGDLLFIPPGWWHQAHSLDPLNVSVNFWWWPPLLEWRRPSLARLLPKMAPHVARSAARRALRRG